MDNSYNLLEEKWVPTNLGLVSLREVFSNENVKCIDKDARHTIAFYNLIKCIAQAACPFETVDEQIAMPLGEFQKIVLEYLDQHHDDFYLYGERPFLQMPTVKGTPEIPVGAKFPIVEIARYGGANVGLYMDNFLCALNDAEKAQLVVLLAACCVPKKGGDFYRLSDKTKFVDEKRKDKMYVIGHHPINAEKGIMNFFCIGNSMLETAFFNMLAEEEIKDSGYKYGFGRPIWEVYPKDERDARAQEIQDSYMGKLMPFAYFAFLDGDDIYITGGIQYNAKQEASVWENPAACVYQTIVTKKEGDVKVEKTVFKYIDVSPDYSTCLTISKRLSNIMLKSINKKMWDLGKESYVISAVGQRYCDNMGLLYYTKTSGKLSDCSFQINVQSVIGIDIQADDDCLFMDKFNKIIEFATDISFQLQKSVRAYYTGIKEKDTGAPLRSVYRFWQAAEEYLSKPLRKDDGSDTEECVLETKKVLNKIACQAYDWVCSKTSRRQNEQWAKHRPSESLWKKPKDIKKK